MYKLTTLNSKKATTMTYQTSYPSMNIDKKMNPEQFAQVVDAILEGKYSWACVLILRFTGYNPLHYIPYRTYNRLLKENCQVGRSSRRATNSVNTDNLGSQSSSISSQKLLNKIDDLAYLELLEKQHTQIEGRGSSQPHRSIKVRLLQCKNKILSIFD